MVGFRAMSLNGGLPGCGPHDICHMRLNTRAMYAVDQVVNVVTRVIPKSRWMFPDGWGDESAIDLLDITKAGPVAPVSIEWHGDEGFFEAPVDDLPPSLQVGRVHRVRTSNHSRRLVVLLPAWDDETPSMRMRFARELAHHGIDSVMLEAAYYGDRRHYLVGPTIRTFEDMTLLSRAIVEEGRSLVRHFMELGYDTGISGFSMGGSLAATAATLLEGDFAVAPLAAAPYPPMLDGVMRPRIDWEALAPATEEVLRQRLMLPSILNVEPSPATKKAVIVAGRFDKFVPVAMTRSIHEHWAGSELRILDAGHATLIVRKHRHLAQAIVDSFSRTF